MAGAQNGGVGDGGVRKPLAPPPPPPPPAAAPETRRRGSRPPPGWYGAIASGGRAPAELLGEAEGAHDDADSTTASDKGESDGESDGDDGDGGGGGGRAPPPAWAPPASHKAGAPGGGVPLRRPRVEWATTPLCDDHGAPSGIDGDVVIVEPGDPAHKRARTQH